MAVYILTLSIDIDIDSPSRPPNIQSPKRDRLHFYCSALKRRRRGLGKESCFLPHSLFSSTAPPPIKDHFWALFRIWHKNIRPFMLSPVVILSIDIVQSAAAQNDYI